MDRCWTRAPGCRVGRHGASGGSLTPSHGTQHTAHASYLNNNEGRYVLTHHGVAPCVAHWPYLTLATTCMSCSSLGTWKERSTSLPNWSNWSLDRSRRSSPLICCLKCTCHQCVGGAGGVMSMPSEDEAAGAAAWCARGSSGRRRGRRRCRRSRARRPMTRRAQRW